MMNKHDHNELHTLADDEADIQEAEASKTKCNGCCTLTEELFECRICSESFCNGEDCMAINYKNTDLNLCTCCQEESNIIIDRLVERIEDLDYQIRNLQ
jgi:hypothetical protein